MRTAILGKVGECKLRWLGNEVEKLTKRMAILEEENEKLAGDAKKWKCRFEEENAINRHIWRERKSVENKKEANEKRMARRSSKKRCKMATICCKPKIIKLIMFNI